MASYSATVMHVFNLIGSSNTTFTPYPNRFTISSDITVSDTIENAKENDYCKNNSFVDTTVKFSIDPVRKAQTDAVVGSKVTAFVLKAGAGSYLDSSAIDASVAAYLNSLTASSKVHFTYSSTTVTIRPPKFSDTQSYETFMVHRESRDKTQIVYRDDMWPTHERLKMEFNYLNKTDAEAMLSFIKLSLGGKITYTDHIGREWQGYITNPDTEAMQAGPTNYQIHIEFEGVLL